MKCSRCGGLAAINLRQHRLRLCADHFVQWFRRFAQRTIEKYEMFSADDRVLVAVSGGKDSLALWEVLLALGHDAQGMYIGLGIDSGESGASYHPDEDAAGVGYSNASLDMCKRFVAGRDEAILHVVDLEVEYGMGVPALARTTHRGRKPCAVCGLVKRHIMNRFARDNGFSAIATGHNLDDEVAILLQNTLHWQTGYLARQAPILQERDGLARKVKPFARIYEREAAAYALVRGIDYVYDECPFAIGSTTNFYKELLNKLEHRSPGAKQQFYLDFLRARREGRILFQPAGNGDEQDTVELRPCRRCGQPTSAGEMCAFCRLWE